jgi:2-polyprenyl-3-methyl-5-hydroxy-6-metoxy-1,4-benzoquinol methylase/glycosyltransferase involved in cell wall biosynthesis
MPNLERAGASRYHVEIDVDSNSTHANVLRLAGSNKRVLELGCATGHMSRILQKNGCQVTAIEIDAVAAEHAAPFCERVIVGDLDSLDFEQELRNERYDVVIAADVLEHLREPGAVLQSVRNYLRPEGYAVVSIPNVAHLSVRLALLAGQFPYAELGLLDRTHLRFFTRESLERLFDDAGFAIGRFQRMEVVPPDPSGFEVPYDPATVPPHVIDALSHDPEALTYQFIVVAYPLPRAGLVLIQDRARRMSYQLEEAQRRAGELQLQADQARSGLAAATEKSGALELERAGWRDRAEQAEGLLVPLREEAARRLEQIESVALSYETATREGETLRRTVTEQSSEIAGLKIQIEALSGREKDLREMLLEAHDQLFRRDDEVTALRTKEVAEASERTAGMVHESQLRASQLRAELAAATEKSTVLESEKAALRKRAEQAEGLLASLREEAASRLEEIESLTLSYEKATREGETLRRTVAEQSGEIAGLEARVETLFGREKDLREMLLEAHDQLLRRDDEVAATMAASVARWSDHSPASTASPSGSSLVSSRYLRNQQSLQRIRELVGRTLPSGGHVLAISRGDDDLLRLEPCTGAHFPQGPGGVYAGYHPANSEAAIAHLKELIAKGARYLLIPQTSLWWLDHYRDFADYLDHNAVKLINEPDICALFDLTGTQENSNSLPVPEHENPLATPLLEAPAPKPFGVNICGHISSEKGTGESVRANIRNLVAAGIPVALNDFRDETSHNVDTEFGEFSEDNPYSVNLIHANADAVSNFAAWKTNRYLQERYSIGFWSWELSTFPKRWLSCFDHFNEIWVPSTFVLDSVARLSPVPVLAMPHSLPGLHVLRNRGRASFDLPSDEFLFLFTFDFMSVLERKNPLGLIEAFKKAFKPRDKVRLVLKVSHAESRASDWKSVEQAAKGAKISIVSGVFNRSEVNTLMSLCDCYVSLHRSEGFGLTMAEAMSLGKPVIATGYSGNMDFMNSANAFLVKHRMLTLDRNYEPYDRGSVWAEPDRDHAAELMRLVFENRKLARAVGRMAQRDVQEKLSISTVGGMILRRLATLAMMGKLSVPEEFLEAALAAPKRRGPSAEYRQQIRQTRKLVQAATPEGATVIVVSKGDEELIRIEGRRGWHFPRQEDGAYAGHHPIDSAAAIGHLEVLRARGAGFLLIPPTSSWWLDHYADFRRHLESCYRLVKRTSGGVLYQLSVPAARFGKPAARASVASSASQRLQKKVNGVAHPSTFARGWRSSTEAKS